MNEKLNKFIYEDCGLYIAKDNDEVTRKEIEFVCEKLIKELLQYGMEEDSDMMQHIVYNKFGVKL